MDASESTKKALTEPLKSTQREREQSDFAILSEPKNTLSSFGMADTKITCCMKIDIFSLLFLFIPVVLIKGGNGSAKRIAEIYNPITKTSCSLPNLPEWRHRHTQDGNLLCGGGGSSTTINTCVKWSPGSGTWDQSHTLRGKRADHLSWPTASGVYLIGSVYYDSSKTSEKVKSDGTVEDGFSLKLNRRSNFSFNFFIH